VRNEALSGVVHSDRRSRVCPPGDWSRCASRSHYRDATTRLSCPVLLQANRVTRDARALVAGRWPRGNAGRMLTSPLRLSGQ
jgi:hypothetical protein